MKENAYSDVENAYSNVAIVGKLVSKATELENDLPKFQLILTGRWGGLNRRYYSRTNLKARREQLQGMFYFVSELTNREWVRDANRQYVLDVLAQADKTLELRPTRQLHFTGKSEPAF